MAFGTDTAAGKLLQCQRACDEKDAEIAQIRADLAAARAENARLREAMPSERLLSDLEESIDEWDGKDMRKYARAWIAKARRARRHMAYDYA